MKDRNLPFTISLWRGTLGSLKTWLLNKARRTNTYGTWYIYPLQGGQYAFHRQELGPKTRAALAISGEVVVWATSRLALVPLHQEVDSRPLVLRQLGVIDGFSFYTTSALPSVNTQVQDNGDN